MSGHVLALSYGIPEGVSWGCQIGAGLVPPPPRRQKIYNVGQKIPPERGTDQPRWVNTEGDSILKEIRHRIFAIFVIDSIGSARCLFVGGRNDIPGEILDHAAVELNSEEIRWIDMQEGADSFEFAERGSLVPAKLGEGRLSEDILATPLFCFQEKIRGIAFVLEHPVDVDIGSQNNLNHFDHLLVMIVAQNKTKNKSSLQDLRVHIDIFFVNIFPFSLISCLYFLLFLVYIFPIFSCFLSIPSLTLTYFLSIKINAFPVTPPFPIQSEQNKKLYIIRKELGQKQDRTL